MITHAYGTRRRGGRIACSVSQTVVHASRRRRLPLAIKEEDEDYDEDDSELLGRRLARVDGVCGGTQSGDDGATRILDE